MRYYSTEEMAKLVGVTRVSIFRWIKEGKIKAERSGHSYIIPEDEVRRHAPLPEDQAKKNEELDAAVKQVVREYGETLKKLGAE